MAPMHVESAPRLLIQAAPNSHKCSGKELLLVSPTTGGRSLRTLRGRWQLRHVEASCSGEFDVVVFDLLIVP